MRGRAGYLLRGGCGKKPRPTKQRRKPSPWFCYGHIHHFPVVVHSHTGLPVQTFSNVALYQGRGARYKRVCAVKQMYFLPLFPVALREGFRHVHSHGPSAHDGYPTYRLRSNKPVQRTDLRNTLSLCAGSRVEREGLGLPRGKDQEVVWDHRAVPQSDGIRGYLGDGGSDYVPPGEVVPVEG